MCYGDQLDDRQMPKSKAARQRFAQQVGIDGFAPLDALDAGDVPPAGLRDLSAVKVLRLAWQRHYAYERGEVRSKESKEVPKEDPRLNYDLEAR